MAAVAALRLTLLLVRAGSGHSTYESLALDFLRRTGRALPSSSRTVRSEQHLLSTAADIRKETAAALWLADLGGLDLTSEQFAARIDKARDGGLRHLMLAIGPADGWSAEARKQADLRFSLGPMTLPHELAALVLAEQIYRASTILQGHPYHLGH